MHLTYIFPSYSRPEVAMFLVENISRQSINKKIGKADIIISIDESDPVLSQYKSIISQLDLVLKSKINYTLEINLLVNKSKGLVNAKNNAVRICESEYIMMLDDDLYMSDDYVDRILSDIKDSSTIGAVSGYITSSVPAISHTQPSEMIIDPPEVGTRLQTLSLKVRDGIWRDSFGKKEQVMDWSRAKRKLKRSTRYEVDYFVNSYLFRKSAWESVGGYNHNLNSLTSAHEEVDYTYRMMKCGYKLVLNPFARMWHITIGKGGIYKGIDYKESKVILEREYKDMHRTFIESIQNNGKL